MLDELHTLLYKRMAEEQLLALLDSPTPLEDVVQTFWKADIDQLEVIKYSIEQTADDAINRRN